MKTILISFLKEGKKSYNHCKLDILNVYDVLKYYESISWSEEEKKRKKTERISGAIYAFKSNVKLSKQSDKKIEGDGVVLIDIDNSKQYADIIMSSITEIAACYPNIMAITKSASGNLHVISYDPDLISDNIKDIYERIELIHLSCFSKAVEKVLNIDLRKDCVLDNHQSSVTQAFFMTAGKFVFNPYYDFAATLNTKEIYKNVKKYTPNLFKTLEKHEAYNKLDDSLKSDASKFNHKFIGFNPVNEIKHIGHTQRMYLYSSLSYLFEGDELNENWIRCCNLIPDTKHSLEYIIDEPVKNHWCKRGFHKDLLNMFGYNYELTYLKGNAVVKESKRDVWKPEIKENVYEIENGKYLYDYIDIIRNEININKELVIKGNTGIGKTYAISRLAKEINGVVIVPFLSLRDNYEDNLFVLDTNDYSKNIPTCMVYDRFALIDIKKFEGKTIFVDESHTLFLDRNYRERLVVTLLKLKKLVNEFNCKVVFISATPLYECKGIKKIEFTKPRPFVNVKVYKVKNTYDTINKMVESNEWRSHYNRMLVFSDLNTRKIKDNHMYMNEKQLSIIHSDYKWTGDMDRICKSNLLDSDVTLATSLAFNGLNFNNKNEKVLIVSELNHDSAAWEIIQQCGRMRNSIVDLRIVYPNTKSTATDIDYKRDKAIAYEMGLDDIIYNTDKSLLKEDIYNANKEIESFINENKGLDNVLKALYDEGYFRINNYPIESNTSCKVVNTMRKQADKLSRGREELNEFENGNLKNYYYECINAKNQLFGIADEDMVYKLMDKVMNRMVCNMCNEVIKCNTIANYSDEEWSHLNDKVDYAIAFWNFNDRILARDIAIDKKKNNLLREAYKSCNDGNEVISKYIDLYLDKQEEGNKKRREFASQNTKSGIVTIKKSNEKFKFESVKQLSEILNLSGVSVSNLIKKGETKYYKVEML